MNNKIIKIETQKKEATDKSQQRVMDRDSGTEDMSNRIKELEKMLKLKDIKFNQLHD